MAHTFTNLLYHAVWSTKNRLPQITDELKPRLLPYIGGIVRELKGVPIIVNGTGNHLHALILLPQTIAVADALRVIKTNSSGWVHKQWPQFREFAWQTGYGAFTVSESNRERVRRYIERQEEHHRRRSFKEEFVALLERHRIEYDPQTIWD